MQKLVKPIAVILTLALALAFVLPSFKVTLANDSSESISRGQILSLVNVIQHGLVKNGSQYSLNDKYAKENGLTATQISNLHDYLQSTPSSEVQDVINQSDEFKNTVAQYSKEHGQLIDISTVEKAYASANFDPLMRWLKTVAWVFVGVGIANQVISDAYKYGFYSACHKWGPTHSSIKTMCKVTGHW